MAFVENRTRKNNMSKAVPTAKLAEEIFTGLTGTAWINQEYNTLTWTFQEVATIKDKADLSVEGRALHDILENALKKVGCKVE